MTCPQCHGSGRIAKRFLFFFTRRARCPQCWGTGEFPPRLRPQVRFGRPSYTDDDDRWARPTFGSSSPSSTSTTADRFDVGSGGRSGGGGATGSWDAPSDSPPVIADPFSSDASSAVSSAIASDASDSASSSSGERSSEPSGSTSY